MNEKANPNGASPLEEFTLAEIRETLERAGELAERVHHLEIEMEWLNHEQAATYLKTTPATLHKIAPRDGIPRHQLTDKKYVYNRRELDDYLRGR